MIRFNKQWTLLKQALWHTIQDYQRGFFIWVIALIPTMICFIVSDLALLFMTSDSTAEETWASWIFLLGFIIVYLFRFCFLNLAVTWHQTKQFSFKAYIKIFRRFHIFLIAVLIEGITFRIVSLFNQLFMGFFSILIVHRKGLWKGLKKSCHLSGQVKLFAFAFFCMGVMRFIITFVLPSFLWDGITLSEPSLYWILYGMNVTLIAGYDIFYLLFKVNAYETVSQELAPETE
jgi:hypothetical protein